MTPVQAGGAPRGSMFSSRVATQEIADASNKRQPGDTNLSRTPRDIGSVPSEREQQFLTLVNQNDSRLRHICRVYSRDAESFKDLHQEILLQLWRSLPSFNGASSPDTWLYRVALNTALAASRRHRPDRVTAPLDDGGSDVEDPAQPDVDELLEARARTERLYAAIDRLNEVDKMLITMYLDERSYRDMADVIGIGVSHIGVRLHRIKKTLGRQLARETV